ncbi:MAG TPA: glycosyltransferase family 1 protein [Desulfobacteraceae bacterium]|nr:glycosyltransferase family 1 protein [Desulfobacteraceae bacterium]HPJ68637.1 glycosyltransferase family 1 protein [Desulfobacteraceae bacterium]HPQ27544.1 glycosyltransferase family 1 protein [Desulfobacteraceae bacterium]
MNILVNGMALTGLLTGVSRYVRCLYNELQDISDTSVTYFTGPVANSEMPLQAEAGAWCKFTERIWQLPDPVVTALRVLHWRYFEIRLRRCCRHKRFDIYHETAFFPAAIKDIPVVYTIYDLSLIKHRKEHPRERLWFFDLFFKRRLPYASHILTISEYVRNEIIEDIGLPSHLVTSIPLAPDPIFYPRSRAEVSEVLKKRGWPEEYILFVGTLEPRKNLSLLVRALNIAKNKIPLIMAGWQGWGDKKWMQLIDEQKLQGNIVFTGHVDEETLACLYTGASAFVYPSLYEGFGLPIIEAMACGSPVVCSNVSSIPEVAGDAALQINPADEEDIAHALDRVMTDSVLRQTLIQRGFERAKDFSWRETAVKTLEVFAQVAEQNSGR